MFFDRRLTLGDDFLFDGIDHLGATLLHLLLIIVAEVAKHAAQASVEERLGLLAGCISSESR